MAMRSATGPWRLDRPHPPLPGESYNGYVARVAAAEGHPHTFELHRIAGLEWPQRTAMAPSCLDGMPALAETLGIDVRELQQRAHAVLPDGVRTWRGMPLERRVLELSTRRFSPASLSTSAHHRALWSVRPFPFCEESWEYLLNRCPDPHCGVVQRWYYPSGIDLCDRCGERLTHAEAVLVDDGLRDRLGSAVGLLHHDPERTSESLSRLPEEVRRLGPGNALSLLLGLARLWEPDLGSRRRTIEAGVPPEKLARAVAEAWSLIVEFPLSVERLAADRLAARRSIHDDGNDGRTLRFLLDPWHPHAPELEPLISSLRSTFERNAVECPTVADVMRDSGTRPRDIARRRREGVVDTVFALDGTRAVARVSREFASRIAERRRGSIPIAEAATMLGIPIYGVEQICSGGLLEWIVDPLPCAVRDQVRVGSGSIDDLAAAITARAIHLIPEDAVPIDRVMLGIGGGPKPWEPLVRGMLFGGVSFALNPRDATVPIFRRLLVSADHVAHVRDLVFAGFGDFPARDLITRAEAGEVINLQKASEAKPMLSMWPAAASGRAVVPAADLSVLAASVIHGQEIAERFGLATSGVNAVLRRADVTGITGGFDRARALPLIADALGNEDAMAALATRVGMRPGVVRRRLRSVGPRYRPRGRPRRGACA
jgi:hypothetical protein